MTTRQHKQELVKLRILSFLGQPAHHEFGALGHDIRHGIESEKTVDEERILEVLVKDGLVKRRDDTVNNQGGKPYFITPKGTTFLEEQTQKAIFPEFAPKSNWASQHTQPRLEDAVSDFIRTVPEFRDAGDERVHEVSSDLSRIVKEHISRTL